MIAEKKLSFESPAFSDTCMRSRNAVTQLDVEFEEFEQELLAAIEADRKEEEK
ncbi:hypothetical protein [Paenibacillus typhae]|uniref:hypothetical protein n=1 Tax=Paenibacillus typhae TaxID=1174501 RepID=UPI001C8D5ABD|nr:hypothetical protein [Paenibacillus typhae]MBY0009764.1 hypothetical protein [Paenibacillus typhae]